MRVLHLVDPGSPGGGACTLRLLAEPLQRFNSVQQDVILIGSRWHESLAERCGVTPLGRISPPRNEPMLAGFGGGALRDLLHLLESSRGRYDLIHAWTPRSALLAGMVAPNHLRIATAAVGPVSSLLMQVLATMQEHRPCLILATSVSVKRDYMLSGIDGELVDVLPPAVNVESTKSAAESRESLRHVWDMDRRTFAVGLLAEPSSWCDARRAISVAALAGEVDRDVRLVVHPEARRRLDASRWAEKIGHGHRIVLDDRISEPWRIMNGLDAALFLGDDTHTLDLSDRGSPWAALIGGGRSLRPMPGVMPALWAMAGGVPVVAEASLAMREIVEDGRTGLLVKLRDVNQAANRLVRLIDDPTVGGRIAAAARDQIRDRFHVSAYCVRLKDLYERMIAHGDVHGIEATPEPEDDVVVEVRQPTGRE